MTSVVNECGGGSMGKRAVHKGRTFRLAGLRVDGSNAEKDPGLQYT